jgi:hypothetical protein
MIVIPFVATLNSGFKLSTLANNNMVDARTSEVGATLWPINPSLEIVYAKSSAELNVCTLFL